MADPLGLIGCGGGGAAGAARGLSGLGGVRSNPALNEPTDPDAPSFKDVLLKNIEQVNKLQQDATAATEDLVTGKRNDVEGVLLATQKADSAFRMLLAVRNKVQAAYEEIKQVRV